MNFLIYLIFVGTALLPSSEDKKSVHLSGQLKGLHSEVIMRYNGASSLIGDSRDIFLKTDSEGFFDTIIHIDKPEYYSISRNTLYLTPGDDLKVLISDNNHEAEFQGTGAEANTYMKKRLFPKGGSFLEGGNNLKEDFVRTKFIIDSLAEVRRQELKELTGVTDEFKILEHARITADVINSYISYGSYAKEFNMNWREYQALSEEEQQTINENYRKKRGEFNKSISEYLNKMYPQVIDDEFLDVAVVRDILFYAQDDNNGWFTGITLPEKTKELYEGYNLVNLLRNNPSPETVKSANDFVERAKNADFAYEVKYKSEQAGKLLKGKPAINILLEDIEGNKLNLTDFNGKAIYIDLWATWCGPCIQESPAFEALAEKYKDQQIVFLPVSTDSKTQTWKNYLEKSPKNLKQYISHDSALKDEWCILYIPRFILIDKDFKIVEAYAPRPSQDEIHSLIDSILN